VEQNDIISSEKELIMCVNIRSAYFVFFILLIFVFSACFSSDYASPSVGSPLPQNSSAFSSPLIPSDPITSIVTHTGDISISVDPNSPLPVTLVAVTVETTPVVAARHTPRPAVTPTPENIWYLIDPVRPAGPSQSDGKTLQSAWREVDEIEWSQIRPYDEIRIGPGFYSRTIQPLTDYVTFRPIEDSVGQIVFDGGRTTALPECGQAEWASDDLGDNYAFWFVGTKGIVLDGGPQRRIEIRNYRYGGIRLEPDTRGIHLRNLLIHSNGGAVEEEGLWRPSRPGILVGGDGHTFDGLIVHDNGEDAIQSHHAADNNLSHLLVRNSLLYNKRMHSVETNLSSNFCTHSDGVQIYSGGVVSGLVLLDSVIGPNFTNGAMLGDKGTKTRVDYALFKGVSFVDISDNAIFDNSIGEASVGWEILDGVNFFDSTGD